MTTLSREIFNCPYQSFKQRQNIQVEVKLVIQSQRIDTERRDWQCTPRSGSQIHGQEADSLPNNRAKAEDEDTEGSLGHANHRK